MILSTIKTYNATSFQIHRLMLSHNNQSFHTKLSKTKCTSFSVICYSESIHTYLYIWIIWYSNAFLIFVCFHISSLSFIQSIQIIMSLILFPESIDKMLSLIYDNSNISNNMIIIMSWFPFWDNNTHMNVSITVFIIFALSSIDKNKLQILFSFSHYCSISIIVLEYTNMVLFDIGYCVELAFQWFETKLMSPFIHILLSWLLYISFPFCSRYWLWIHFHFHIINQRYWCPFAKPILLLLLFLFTLLFVGNG